MQIITSAIDSRDGVFSGGKQSPSDNSLIPTPMTTKSALTAPTLIVVGMAVSLVAGSSARADIAYDCTDRFGRTQTYITSGSAVCADQPRVIIPVKDTRKSYPMQPKILVNADFVRNDFIGNILDNTMPIIHPNYQPSIITKQHPIYAPIKSSWPKVQPFVTNVGYPSLPTMVYPTVPQLQPTVTPVGYPHAPTMVYPTVPQLQPTVTPVGYPHAPTRDPRPYVNGRITF